MHAFHMTLHRLRAAAGTELVICDDGRFTFNPAVVYVDAWALERLLDRAEALSEERQEERAGLRVRIARLWGRSGASGAGSAASAWTARLASRVEALLETGSSSSRQA
jgi:hypothetical protein